MADAGLSATESALENQRIGGLQIRVAAFPFLREVDLFSAPRSRNQVRT
jgi:hypothetical protein